jgi:GNAT superfamily N-acetyltransferase
MDQWRIEPWTADQDRSQFSCGNILLDEFLRFRVGQYEKRSLGKTFVAITKDSRQGHKTVIGYYALAAGSIEFQNLPIPAARKLPKHPVPIVLLARLAVDKSSQGKGLGEGLLIDSLQRSLSLSADLGIHAVVVEAIDDSAASFYKKYGFIPLLDDSLHLYLPIATIAKIRD